MSKRIYISGAISGTDDFMERFARMQERLEGMGHSVINPACANLYLPEDTSYEEYMKVSFCLIDLCGCVCLMDGWEKSRGARRERAYAEAREKEIMFESGLGAAE